MGPEIPIHTVDACVVKPVYYIEDLSYTYLKILQERSSLQGIGIVTGIDGVNRDPLGNNNASEKLYALLLPLTRERAEEKRGLWKRIQKMQAEIDARDRPKHENLDKDFDRDRYWDHVGINPPQLTARLRTHCELFPEFGDLCREYDGILPEPPSEPAIALFSFPGITRLDPVFVNDYHGFRKGEDPEAESLIRYRRGQVLDALPENVYILVPKTETHFTPKGLVEPQ